MNFRFYLIKDNPVHDAINLPNGIILVPKEFVERLTDDSQLAAVLASSMASVLEKQAYREGSKLRKALVAEWIGGGATFFLSTGPGVAVWATAHHIEHSTLLRLEGQTDRVSSELLSDAGYDVREAPIAWWKLNSKHPDELWLTEPPEKSGYLFGVLAVTAKTATEAKQAELPAKVEAGQSK